MTNQKCEAKAAVDHHRWIAGISMLAGAAMGAAVMYLWDPRRGKARRAEVRQKTARTAKQAGDELEKKAEDLLNRIKGFLAEAHAAMEHREEAVDDDIVAERVRSHLGHLTEHASAIQTEVVNGVVALRGTISPDKKRAVVDQVLSLPGVKGIRDLLVAA